MNQHKSIKKLIDKVQESKTEKELSKNIETTRIENIKH